MVWHGLARLLPEGWRRSDAAGLLDLATCYRDLKNGRATKAQFEKIIADVAEFSGYYKVNPPGLSADERSYAEGARSVFARMLSGLLLNDDEFIALQEAARLEALARQSEARAGNEGI